jgi:CDP-glycerol glycerophosphotransferase (TagB/SpsB family)
VPIRHPSGQETTTTFIAAKVAKIPRRGQSKASSASGSRQFWLERFKRALVRAITWLDRRIPEKPHQLLFGADQGQRFAENPRQLFEYMARLPAWQPFWVSRSRKVVREVNRSYPGRALWWFDPRALWVGLRSRFFVISHSRQDVLPAGFSLESKFIHLTHGTPLKAMGRLRAGKKNEPIRGMERFCCMVASSDFVADLWATAYGIPRERIEALGLPRNDLLFERDARTEAQLAAFSGKIVLYAPTFRDWTTRSDFLPVPGLDVHELNRLLEDEDATLLVRPHAFEASAAAATLAAAASSRIVQADSGLFPDVNQLLPFVDVLITDYSSIYFDYLLLDRPIIFAPWDLHAYTEKRGFMLNYDAHTPGAKVVSPTQFLSTLRKELAGLDPHRVERGQARSLFHKHLDAGNCARLEAFITEHAAAGRG